MSSIGGNSSLKIVSGPNLSIFQVELDSNQDKASYISQKLNREIVGIHCELLRIYGREDVNGR